MAESNPNSRLEAFCDGVFAIAITLLIIEIHIPSIEDIHSTEELWRALEHLLPSIFAFLLSFATIFITWINHHATLKLVNKSSPAFIYANGFLLLTVVILPFPTALLGEYLFTDYAAPAVVLYAGADALISVGWLLMTGAALRVERLTRNEKSTLAMREVQRRAILAVPVYSVCAIVAIWFPLAIAGLITLTWIAWIIVGLRIKGE